jgi:hypothetical protein
MKKFFTTLTVILFVFIISDHSFAQPLEGKKFEFSTSASMWNIKSDGGETETLINLPIRMGFFVFKGLEIEPELFFTIPEESEDIGYIIIGNLSYNFKTSGNLMLFALGGAGFGNGQRLLDLVVDQEMGVTVYNFGAGLKYLVGDSAAIRIEYRHTNYSGEKTGTSMWGDWTDKLDRTDNNIFIGVSIFF